MFVRINSKDHTINMDHVASFGPMQKKDWDTWYMLFHLEGRSISSSDYGTEEECRAAYRNLAKAMKSGWTYFDIVGAEPCS